MSNALMDALLPASKTPRPADAAAPRASERGKDFAPVLNKALDARSFEPAAATRDDDAKPVGAPVAPATGDAAGSGNAGARQDAGASKATESDERTSRSPGEAEDVAEDAVEISAEAEAEAAAAAVAAAAGAPVTAEEQLADQSTTVQGIAVATSENAAGDPDAENAPTSSATPGAATAEASSEIAAESTEDAATPSRVAKDAEAGRDRNVEKSAGLSAQTSAESDAATDAVSPAHENSQQSPRSRKARAANDQPAASDWAPLPQDHASAADASPEWDAALESWHRGEAAGDASEGTQSHVAAAPAVPEITESGRSPAHSAALSRLAAERSLHVPADSAGDDAIGRGRFVGRVEGAIRAAQQREGRIHVRLSPPELGALRIELTLQQGALAARLEAETPAARNLLLDNLPALRDRLAQQDIRVERFDVDLRQDANSGGSSSQQGTMQERQPRETEWRQNPARSDLGRSGAPTSPTTTRSISPSAASDLGLDVRV